jgi:hypothetical protein
MSDAKLELHAPPPAVVPLDYVAEAPQPLASLIRAVGVLVAIAGTVNLAMRIYTIYLSMTSHITIGVSPSISANVEIVFAGFQTAAGLVVAIRPRLFGLVWLWALGRVALSLTGLILILYSMLAMHVNRQAMNFVPYQILSSIRTTVLESFPPLMILFIYRSWKRSVSSFK